MAVYVIFYICVFKGSFLKDFDFICHFIHIENTFIQVSISICGVADGHPLLYFN